MGEQLQRTVERTEEAEQVDAKLPAAEASVDMDEIDKLLDSIDELLEEDAEAFVKAYQQRGGQ